MPKDKTYLGGYIPPVEIKSTRKIKNVSSLPAINYDKTYRDTKAPTYNVNGLPSEKEVMTNYIKANPTKFPDYFKSLPIEQQKEAFNTLVRDRPDYKELNEFSLQASMGFGIAPVAGLEYVSKIPGVKKAFNYVGNKLKPEVAERLLTNEELLLKRTELAEQGILKEQKTLNMPYKNTIHKGIDPYGYDIKEKLSSLKSLFKDSKNPMLLEDDAIKRAHATYQNEAIKQNITPISFDDFKSGFNPDQLEPSLRKVTQNKFERRFATEHPTGINSSTNKNRYATWNMYLGKSQAEHPLYDVSRLSTNKKNIYTIKEPYINKEEVELQLSNQIKHIEELELNPENAFLKRVHKSSKISKNTDGSYNIPDRDNPYFGTMGGFNWNVKKLPNGNYEAMANDVWDLQPLKNQIIGNSDKLSGRMLNSIIKPFKNIEVGKTLGIGKPLDVKVGFNIDGKTKKIINTFGLTGLGIGLNKRNNGRSK
jgi:hypothetical protein